MRMRKSEVEENNGKEVDGNRMRMRKGREEKGKGAVRERNEEIRANEVDELQLSEVAGVIGTVIGDIAVSSKRKSCQISDLYTHAHERYP